jgi:hypothetical protein
MSGIAGEPEDIVLRDRVLQLLGVAWIATMCAAIAPVAAVELAAELTPSEPVSGPSAPSGRRRAGRRGPSAPPFTRWPHKPGR